MIYQCVKYSLIIMSYDIILLTNIFDMSNIYICPKLLQVIVSNFTWLDNILCALNKICELMYGQNGLIFNIVLNHAT